MSDSVRPHGLQPTRVLCPWDFPGIMLGTGNSEISTCFLFGHLLHLVNSSNCFSLWIFPPIFFASAVIHSIITTCVSHCNYQLVPKLFFGIYVSAKLIIVLRYGTVWGFPGNSAGKESACNAGDPSSIPGSEGSAVEGIGYPLQYSWASLWLGW